MLVLRNHAIPARLGALALFVMSATPSLADRFSNGVSAYERGRYVEAARYWEDVASGENHIAAQYNLGLLYEQGMGVRRNPGKAAHWYRLAAQQGYAPAQFNLGGLHHRGDGIPKNETEAVYWWAQAAQRGFTDAQFLVGVILIKGELVPQNLEDGMTWIKAAAVKGHAKAEALLAAMQKERTQAAVTAMVPPTRAGAQRAAGVLSDVAWIRRQLSGKYTIQLYVTKSATAANEFIRRHGIESVATCYPGNAGFVVIGGVFDDKTAATEALSRLTDDVRRNNPSVRSFRSVQMELAAGG